ncbi:MAG: polysaccharide pyruvyl transferase family protein [Clostridiales bacterium]|nr:polysaccharide pyruvyl transferase family protein [Clostridiales bacterium]
MNIISIFRRKSNQNEVLQQSNDQIRQIRLSGSKIEPKLEYKKEERKTVLINPIMAGSRKLGHGITQKLNDYGSNTGNMLFVEAMKEQLNYVRELSPGPQRGTSLDFCNMVIPSSNFIIRGDTLFIERLQQLLDTTKGLVTMAGLGAQSNAKDDTPKRLVADLKPYKIKFFKDLSERAVSLGVRGEFTAACLEKMGIYNYRIIGCPSAYHQFDGVFRVNEPSAGKCLFNVTTKNSYESKIVQLGMQKNSKWIMQMMTELPLVASGEQKMTEQEFNTYFPNMNIPKEELVEYMKKNAHIFFTYEDWVNYLQDNKFTFSFGSRFHGNMFSLRNGIPALWITHDSRTSELVRTLHLPSIDYSVLSKVNDIEELIPYCNYDEHRSAYKKMTENYVQFLEENGLNHKFKLHQDTI